MGKKMIKPFKIGTIQVYAEGDTPEELARDEAEARFYFERHSKKGEDPSSLLYGRTFDAYRAIADAALELDKKIGADIFALPKPVEGEEAPEEGGVVPAEKKTSSRKRKAK